MMTVLHYTTLNQQYEYGHCYHPTQWEIKKIPSLFDLHSYKENSFTVQTNFSFVYCTNLRAEDKMITHVHEELIRGCIQKFPDRVGNEINNNNSKKNTRWEATQRVMVAKHTRLTHKIAIKL